MRNALMSISAGILLCCALAVGQVQTPATGAPSQHAADIRIVGGDLLDISVFDVPELTGKMRVTNTGTIVLPLAGEIHVAGFTLQQAQTEIADRLRARQMVNDPQVTVFVEEYATQGVSIAGEVKKPGIYPALGGRRLLDYISQAEGLTILAASRVTIANRATPEHIQNVLLVPGESQNPSNNPEILPGDIIVVERAGIVYVVGDVARPGGFPMQHNERLTVVQALALAQGANRTAALKSARLIRTSAKGREEVPVELDKVLSLKAADIALQDEDILFVPTSAAKSAAKRGIEAVLQAATGVAVYRR